MRPICRVLPIAPSTYCAHAARRADPDKQSARTRSDAALMIEIQRVFETNFCVYGVRKIWRRLAREGIVTARCTMARLMRRLGLAGVVRGRTVRTTIPDPAAACPLDRVNRQFKAPRPNALWVSDFTYVATWSGFVYVAFVIDVFARRIPRVRLRRPEDRLWLAGLTQCSCKLRSGCPGAGPARAPSRPGQRSGAPLGPRLAIFGSTVHRAPGRCGHRDVGRQRRRQLRQRLTETINRLFKAEVIHRRGPWRSFEAVEYATLEWVDWYNHRRLLAPIGNVPPAEAEARYHAHVGDQAMAA